MTSGAHESKSLWFRDVWCSWRLDIKTPRLQSVLISWHHYLMMDWVQGLFSPFWCSFVPDVSFGNGWFASSDWPANKRERDVIFDPFLSPRNIICFGTRQAVFSVTRNRFRNRKQLARKGVGNSSEVVVFYRGHRGPTRNLAIEGCSNALRKKQRISWRKNCHFKEGKEPIAPIIFGGWDRKIPDSIREIGRVFEGLIHQISSLNTLSHAIKRRLKQRNISYSRVQFCSISVIHNLAQKKH